MRWLCYLFRYAWWLCYHELYMGWLCYPFFLLILFEKRFFTYVQNDKIIC